MGLNKRKIHDIIFEADTFSGKLFDIVLIVAIVFSVIVVMLESVESLALKYASLFYTLEWIFTILFTIEYILRVWIVKQSRKYVLSFFGMVDLLSILPTFLSLIISGTHSLMMIRTLRLLRIFRILKLTVFLGEAKTISNALKASRAKITVFLVAVLCLVFILGTVMYLIEGVFYHEETNFTSIPRSIYWAIVTLTTVGYGDIAPVTVPGQFIASIIMILGYGILAVPTGIVGAEIARHDNTSTNTQSCQNCSSEEHRDDAVYCDQCGALLNPSQNE